MHLYPCLLPLQGYIIGIHNVFSTYEFLLVPSSTLAPGNGTTPCWEDMQCSSKDTKFRPTCRIYMDHMFVWTCKSKSFLAIIPDLISSTAENK